MKPDFVGFTIPNEFVVGYGLDYRDQYHEDGLAQQRVSDRQLRYDGHASLSLTINKRLVPYMVAVAGGQPTERRKLLSYRAHDGLRPDSEQKRYQSGA